MLPLSGGIGELLIINLKPRKGGFMNNLLKLARSRTFWFNVVTGALIITDQLTGSKVISPEVSASIVAIGNVVLRLITTKPISEK